MISLSKNSQGQLNVKRYRKYETKNLDIDGFILEVIVCVKFMKSG